jgi:hypothetical protein
MVDAEARFAVIAELKGDTGLLCLHNLPFGRLIDEVVSPYETDKPFFVDGAPVWMVLQRSGTDRAHRIGQTRPVTVYRLVTADTIEEKLIELHKRKRELAQLILDGTHASARLDAQDLLRALRGG